MASPLPAPPRGMRHPTGADLQRLYREAKRGIHRQNGSVEAAQGYLRRVQQRFDKLLKRERFYVEGLR